MRLWIITEFLNSFNQFKQHKDKLSGPIQMPGCFGVCEELIFVFMSTFRASNFQHHFIWLHRSIPRINRMNTKQAISLSNSSKPVHWNRNVWTGCFPFVRRYAIQRTCLECVMFSHFISFVGPSFFSFFVVLLLVLDIAFTFNAHRANIRNHFCARSHWALCSFSVRAQSNRCLFALHYLYIYISAHKYRL